jgi:aspartate/methionine/tyrosine aminotransferase
MNIDPAFAPLPRPQVLALLPSRIREIANLAMGRSDVAAFWFGESDQPTPQFIRQAAMDSMGAGQTYYTQNLGRPLLRSAIANYATQLHGTPIASGRVAVTGSGVSALMLSAQMLLSPGDRVVVVTPIWPNIAEIPRILGADVIRVPLAVANGRWALDLEALLAALTPQTKLLFLNSPNNPTGWTIGAEEQKAVFEHCRKLGIWIVSDDVYERLNYAGGQTPSMLAYADPEDRLISVNSFSKAWCMTGWRIGWLVAPEAFMPGLTKVIEYNTSCVPDFVQQGAIAALEPERGEAFTAELLKSLAASRARLIAGLRAHEAIEVPEADGAMYAFFRVKGHDDCMKLAYDLLRDVGLGLAPGSAFGEEGEGWLRWCFAASPDKIDDGLQRLGKFLAR